MIFVQSTQCCASILICNNKFCWLERRQRAGGQDCTQRPRGRAGDSRRGSGITAVYPRTSTHPSQSDHTEQLGRVKSCADYVIKLQTCSFLNRRRIQGKKQRKNRNIKQKTKNKNPQRLKGLHHILFCFFKTTRKCKAITCLYEKENVTQKTNAFISVAQK